MSRTVWRVRHKVTGDWLLTHHPKGILGGVLQPVDYRNALEARHAARFMRGSYRLVKVTIRTGRRELFLRWLLGESPEAAHIRRIIADVPLRRSAQSVVDEIWGMLEKGMP